jgi:hypothetical protein
MSSAISSIVVFKGFGVEVERGVSIGDEAFGSLAKDAGDVRLAPALLGGAFAFGFPGFEVRCGFGVNLAGDQGSLGAVRVVVEAASPDADGGVRGVRIFFATGFFFGFVPVGIGFVLGRGVVPRARAL